MNLLQAYSDLLSVIAAQNDGWSVKTKSPFTISREIDESQLALSISAHGSETKAHLYFNLYDDDALTELAAKVLKAQQKETIQKKDDDSGLFIIIDSDGFAVAYDATDVSIEDFTKQFDSLVETADSLLMKVVTSAQNAIKESEEAAPQTNEASQAHAQPLAKVLEQYFAEKEYKNSHQEERERYVFGFSTTKYINPKGDQNVNVVINYSDKELLRLETPWLYQFDLDKTEYSLIATAIAWFQFEYKFLAMSLDPSDGELKVSIDIPLGEGTLHTTQIHRIVTFIIQFTEATYEELFSLLLSDSQAAGKKLKGLLDGYKDKVDDRRWVESVKDKMQSLTEDQKQAIEAILEQQNSESNRDGI
ncbi:hypothetical protein K0504_01655 [Neiella marina]|uniref:YbjN domain-containing protein n=1 Tax=Neiella holothuriorum TaxID=2870530 RepID=A0ABS7EDD6_9GAMM|nr:hypothetical protein [Neiella holothuriorum]MBW8189727.1 hypothetical protein [Neiella holothuriorum]